MPSIILTADDYGANDFIDNGIIKAIQDGVVNSVAAFVTFPDSQARIQRLINIKNQQAALGNTIGIGLHFSLTAGWPIIRQKNTLTNPHSNDFIFRNASNYPFNKVSKTEIKNELQAQVDTLAAWVGGVYNIDHVSNHHGVTYIDTSIFNAYADQISNNHIPIRSPLNWSRSRLKYMDFDPFIPSFPLAMQGVKLRWMEKVFETGRKKISRRVEYAQGRGIRFPYCVADTFYGQPFVENIDYLISQLQSTELAEQDNQCVEIMFHLGNYAASPFQPDPDENSETHGIDPSYYSNRKLELNAIRKYNWTMALPEINVQKITYRELT